MRIARTIVVVAVISCVALAGDPSTAISAGRQYIAGRQFAEAVKVLQDAVPDAATLQEPNRTNAMGALHFYTAIAFSGMNAESEAREALEHFSLLSPMNKIDATKFDAKFVRLFNEVIASMAKERASAFETAYPDYRTFRDELPAERRVEQWGDGPELALLGTAEEKAEWRRLREDDQRKTFIESFWTRRSDRRAEFLRRVAFADQAFAREKMRGSPTDRGRVFALFGPPKIVRRVNLTEADGATVVRRGGPVLAPESAPQNSTAGWTAMQLSERQQLTPSLAPIVKGSVERWLYSRDQLPKGFPDDQLAFKFVTEEGYGEGVLQRDFLVLKALKDAARIP